MVCEEGYSQTLFRQRQLSGFALIAKTATSQNGCELYAIHVHDNEDSSEGLHNWTADAKDADFGGPAQGRDMKVFEKGQGWHR